MVTCRERHDFPRCDHERRSLDIARRSTFRHYRRSSSSFFLKTQCEEVVDKAVKEMAMEKVLRELDYTWKTMAFSLEPLTRTKLSLIAVQEELIEPCSAATNFLFAGCVRSSFTTIFFSLTFLFGSQHDGSVVVFDTSEPNRYKPNSSEPLPCAPTFSTGKTKRSLRDVKNFLLCCLSANIQFNDRHFNEVIRVVPLRSGR